MLVVCNGTMKSGSTWLLHIVSAEGSLSRVDERYQHRGWRNPSIGNEAFSSFFGEAEYKKKDYFCKQHWYGSQKYKDLLVDDSVKVLNIKRDLRDVLVSWYFHDKRLGRTQTVNAKDWFFNGDGAKMMQRVVDYQSFWHGNTEQQPFLCSYEGLHADFDGEVKKIFEFIERPVSEKQLATIKELTSFTSKEKVGDGSFFRKGEVGDWANHLDSEVVDALNQMAKNSKYPFLDNSN